MSAEARIVDAAAVAPGRVVRIGRPSGAMPDRCYAGRMAGLRGDLIRLGIDRANRGAVSPDTVGAAVVAVEANVYRAPADRLRSEVERFSVVARLGISREHIDAAVFEHLQRFPAIEQFIPLKQRDAGKELALAMEERRRLRINTMKAVDETDESRADYVRQEKLKRDREYQRKRRAKQRAAGQSVTRVEYEANSLSALKPWDAEGIHRRTWERRRAASVSSLDNIKPEATDLRQHRENIEERNRAIGRQAADIPKGAAEGRQPKARRATP